MNDIFEFRLQSPSAQNDACTLYEHQRIVCCSYKVQSNQTVAAGKRAERKKLKNRLQNIRIDLLRKKQTCREVLSIVVA